MKNLHFLLNFKYVPENSFILQIVKIDFFNPNCKINFPSLNFTQIAIPSSQRMV